MTTAAETLKDLILIRASNRNLLDKVNGAYGTALGKKNGNGPPAVLVFVERKIHKRWLIDEEVIAPELEAPSGLVCPTDVIQVGGDLAEPYSPGRMQQGELWLREQLRGAYERISVGSQLSFVDISGGGGNGTLGAFATCRRTGKHGLITNAHVAEFVGNILAHPEESSTAIARVDRLVRSLPLKDRFDGLVTDASAFSIMDCAFAEFGADVELTRDIDFDFPYFDDQGNLTGGALGTPLPLNLEDQSLAPIGECVVAVGRTRSYRSGVIRAFGFEHADGVHVSGFTDFLISTEELSGYFSVAGDSGSLVVTSNGFRPVALLWGGMSMRTNPDYELVDHTFAVDINSVLDVLNVDLLIQAPSSS